MVETVRKLDHTMPLKGIVIKFTETKKKVKIEFIIKQNSRTYLGRKYPTANLLSTSVKSGDKEGG